MVPIEEPCFEIFQGKNDLFYWHLVGANGEVMTQSEGYVTVANAKRAVERFKEIVLSSPKIVQVDEDEDELERSEQED